MEWIRLGGGVLYDNGTNVGIGTTNPTYDLDIYKNEVNVNQRVYANDALGIGHSVTGANGGGEINLIANSSASTYLGIPVGLSGLATNYTDMVFASGTGGTATEKMRLTTGGNLAIGTTAASYTLSLGGDVDRTIGMERTTGTDGFDLTVQAGGAKAGTSDNDGGDLILSGGIATGNGSIVPKSNIIFKTTTQLGSSSSADQLPSEKMRVTANGRLGVGTTNPQSRFHATDNFANYNAFVATIENTGDAYGSGGLLIQAGQNTWSGNTRFVRFSTPNGTEIGAIAQGTSSSVFYATTSDSRLKSNISPTRMGLTDLMNIPVHDYEYKADPGKTQIGFIAQELYEVLPSAVSVGGEDAKTEPWMVDYSKLTPLLVKAVQDQQALIETLNARISELEKRVDK